MLRALRAILKPLAEKDIIRADLVGQCVALYVPNFQTRSRKIKKKIVDSFPVIQEDIDPAKFWVEISKAYGWVGVTLIDSDRLLR